MKAFLEEYGLIVVVTIVALILIAMATPIGEKIEDSITAIVDKFLGDSGVPVTPGA